MVTKRKRSSAQTAKPGGKHMVSIPFEFLPVDVPLLYVDNLNIVHTATEFTLSFMQSQPPLLESEDDWNDVKAIPLKCVSRIVVNPMKMQMILKTLVVNYEQYRETFHKSEEDNGTNATKTSSHSDAD
jgi:hypothetical protein